MGVPLVRENLLLLLWVFPAIVVFFGALAIGCTFCCKRKPSWQKVPASWMTGCVFLQAPCIFIFASFWFVLIMFWADACQGFPNVAMQYVDGLQDDLCTEIANGALTPRARFVCVVLCVCVVCVCLWPIFVVLPFVCSVCARCSPSLAVPLQCAGEGNATACMLSRTVSGNSYNTTFNVREAIAGVLGNCPGMSATVSNESVDSRSHCSSCDNRGRFSLSQFVCDDWLYDRR
jgi:hypothetical protein